MDLLYIQKGRHKWFVFISTETLEIGVKKMSKIFK